MANNLINQYLEMANFQMAAEAFLMQQGESSIPADRQVIVTRLTDGNTHASRFTLAQANKFFDQYEIVTQYRNDPLKTGDTGFSATLFRNRQTGELTISFRSTEFLDDNVRDNKSTNDLELKELGWGFGQISAMEAWYAQVRDQYLTDENGNVAQFNVTGYSLGAHLATAFTILRREQADVTAPDPIKATYTFNGAGTGQTSRRLTDVITDFNRIRANPYASLELTSLTTQELSDLLSRAQMRVNAINSERAYVAGVQNIQNGSFGGSTPPAGIQATLEYQIAALLVARYTTGALASNPPSPGGAAPLFVSSNLLQAPLDQRFSNMTEIVGMETGGLATSFTSNAGIHYGQRIEVPIEAQPLYRGSVGLDMVKAAIQNFSLKLLVNDPANNDFGDTHSLVLLIDSLTLLAAMEKLAPALTWDTGTQILAAMSSASISSADGPNGQGKAEGDTLEKMLDALRKLILGPSILPTLDEEQMQKVLEGNTWHDATLRAQFQDNLQELRDDIDDLVANNSSAPFTIDDLTTISSTQLADIAGSSEAIAYRYALQELNPFAVLGDAAVTELYNGHNVSGELDLYNATDRTGALTTEWITDRSAFLRWKNIANTQNTLTNTSEVALLQSNLTTVSQRFIDLSQKIDLGVVPLGGGMPAINNSPRYVFGGDSSDNVAGGAQSDRLYGGAGNDTLTGGKGADYLEGGSGSDTYHWNSGDGFDTLLDIDGSGTLVVDGHVLTGGIAVSSGDYFTADDRFWLHFEGNLMTGGTLTVNGELRIEDFRNGDLGITLGALGNLSDLQLTNNELSIILDPAHFTQIGTEDSDEVHVMDLARSSAEGSIHDLRLLMTLGGDDLVVFDGPFQADNFIARVSAGEGNDFVLTTSASEIGDGELFVYGGLVEGGSGQDTIIGGDGDDILVGDSDALGTYISLEGASPTFNLIYNEPDTLGSDGSYFYFSEVDNIGGYSIEGDDLDHLKFFPNGISEVLSWLGLISPVDDPAANDDFISGGAGNDEISGGAGNDDLFGGAGDDLLYGDSYSPTWPVRDLLSIGNPDIRAIVENYFVPLLSQTGNDYFDGGDGNDRLFDLDGGSNVLLGGGGDDTLRSYDNFVYAGGHFRNNSPVNNLLDGGDGDDALSAFNFSPGGVDSLVGGSGNDSLSFRGKSGVGILDGGSGSDIYYLPSIALPLGQSALSNKVIIRDQEGGVGEVDVLRLSDFQHLLDGVSFSRDESNLYLSASGRVDWVTIENWFIDPKFKIEKIEIYGGLSGNSLLSQFDIAAIESRLVTPTAGDDFLWGTSGADQISGDGGDDEMDGNAGDDALHGGAGNDTLDGGAGNDVLDGETGDDTYRFGRGDGADTIQSVDVDAASVDTLQFKAGVTELDVHVSRSGADIGLAIVGTQESITITNGFATDIIDRVTFANGTTWDAATLRDLASISINTTPYLINAIADTNAIEDTVFNYTVPSNTFADTDLGDMLAYSVTLADNTAIPQWLSFDAATRKFSGLPDSGDVGTVSVKVTATDTSGASVADTFDITVTHTNGVPTVPNAIADQTVAEDAAFSYTVPADTFTDAETGGVLTYTASVDDGSAFPTWLTFDAGMRIFSGTPLNADVGKLDVRVTATDLANASVSDVFQINVANVNDNPILATTFINQNAIQNQPFSYALPAGTFTDEDAGDQLSYSATLNSGAALPVWLAFDDATSTFSGTPLSANVGNLNICVTATDGSGETATGTFALAVTNVSAFSDSNSADVVSGDDGAQNTPLSGGDSVDVVSSDDGEQNTPSLGGAIGEDDLPPSKSGDDLVINTVQDKLVSLNDWNPGSSYQIMLKIQMMLDAASDFDLNSADLLHNEHLHSLDFPELAIEVDQMRGASPALTNWQMINAMALFHISGSNDAVMGGDLANYYSVNGGLTGISLNAAQKMIGATGFGQDAQSLRPFSGLQEGMVRLS